MSATVFAFMSNATVPGYGAVFNNEKYSVAVIHINGNFSTAYVSVEARNNLSSDWHSIGGYSLGKPNTALTALNGNGIYEIPIDGIRQIRCQLLSTDGSVNISAVFYDSADGETYPPMDNGITLGGERMFVKGDAEEIFFDPLTGNIIGYDRLPFMDAITVQTNLPEITGGIGNRVLAVIPDSAVVSGRFESHTFSTDTLKLISGGSVAYDAVARCCETVIAQSNTLTVSGTPCPSYTERGGSDYWTLVKDVDTGEQMQTRIDPNGTVAYFATVGHTYEVYYHTHKTSATVLNVPTRWNPVIMTLQVRLGVYNDKKRGRRIGWLYFIVPKCVLTIGETMRSSQTDITPSDGNWVALSDKRNMPNCDCGYGHDPLAYYVYVPCDCKPIPRQIVAPGNGLTLSAGQSRPLPLKFVMPNGSLTQADYGRMLYVSGDESVATVAPDGFVHAENEGRTVVFAYLSDDGYEQIQCAVPVVVEGIRVIPRAQASHIVF